MPHRSHVLLAAGAAGLMALAGCGDDSPAQAAAAATSAPASAYAPPVATVPVVGGVSTEITLDPATLATLGKAG